MWIRVTTINEYTGKEVEQLVNMDWATSVGPYVDKPDPAEEAHESKLKNAKSVLGVNTEGDSYNVYLKDDLENVHRKMNSAQARAISPQG